MSDNIVTQAFLRRIDDTIALANDQVSSSNVGEVSTSLLCATAHFNAFNVANMSRDGADMQVQKEEVLKHFTEMYRNLLEESFDDYVQNFDEYRS